MLTTSDFKKGVRVELDNAPWTIVSVTTQTPSARGAATLVKARFKNILTGQVSDRTFKAGEKFVAKNCSACHSFELPIKPFRHCKSDHLFYTA